MKENLLGTGAWRRQWPATPVLLPGKSHGRRNLVGCRPWGHKESDTTERLHFHFSLSCTGEGNGNPLQCSCLENPRDGGAWWAAVHGVAQSRTRLKRLSGGGGAWKWCFQAPRICQVLVLSSFPFKDEKLRYKIAFFYKANNTLVYSLKQYCQCVFFFNI